MCTYTTDLTRKNLKQWKYRRHVPLPLKAQKISNDAKTFQVTDLKEHNPEAFYFILNQTQTQDILEWQKRDDESWKSIKS